MKRREPASIVPTDRTRDDGHKLKYMKFHLIQEYPFFFFFLELSIRRYLKYLP